MNAADSKSRRHGRVRQLDPGRQRQVHAVVLFRVDSRREIILHVWEKAFICGRLHLRSRSFLRGRWKADGYRIHRISADREVLFREILRREVLCREVLCREELNRSRSDRIKYGKIK